MTNHLLAAIDLMANRGACHTLRAFPTCDSTRSFFGCPSSARRSRSPHGNQQWFGRPYHEGRSERRQMPRVASETDCPL